MPTNLRPGEGSRARIQYLCLSASVFIRCVPSAIKGRLQSHWHLKETKVWRIHHCGHRRKHHHNVRFCCDGLICCLLTGHTGLLWQADRGIDPWAGLKSETVSDLSSTLSVFTMANGLRRLLSKVSSHEKKTFTLSRLKSRMQKEPPLPVSQGQKEQKEEGCGFTKNPL